MKILLKYISACCLYILIVTQIAFSQGLQVGVAKRVITPDPLLPVSGMQNAHASGICWQMNR